MLGDNIKKLRTERGLSQQELADKLHVSRPTISSWESNRTEPTMGNIEQLAIVFNCKKSELLGETKTAINLNDLVVELDTKDDEIRALIETAKKSDIKDIRQARQFLRIMQYKPLIDSILKIKE